MNGLFFCFKGENADSHDFAKEAVKNGAVALIVEREVEANVPQILVKDARETLALLSSEFYGNPSEKMKVIGITGGVGSGKTQVLEYLNDKYGATICLTDEVEKSTLFKESIIMLLSEFMRMMLLLCPIISTQSVMVTGSASSFKTSKSKNKTLSSPS